MLPLIPILIELSKRTDRQYEIHSRHNIRVRKIGYNNLLNHHQKGSF